MRSGDLDYWATARRGQVSRRRLIGGAAVISAGTAFALACGGGDKKEDAARGAATVAPAGGATAAAETPKPGGQLREATITQTPHFSPFHPGADPSYINTWRRVNGYYEPLWAIKDVRSSDRVALRLAASIEQPDESTYVVKMHPSTFHNRPPANGREVTAEDVVAVVEFLKKPPASGGSFIQSGKDLKSVTAVDKLTLRYETFGPRAFFYENLGANGATVRGPVPKEMLDEQTLKQTPPVGSGPYEYKSHTQGSTEEAKRFENYRLKPRPYIAEKKITFMPDASAIEAAFRANQTDTTPESFSDVKQKDAIARDLGNRIKTLSLPSTSGMALLVNINRPPWNDVHVREAIYRAIDVERIINVVYFGDAKRTWYFSEARTERAPIKWDDVKQYVGYDPKKAADLIKAAGIDPNKEYEFMVPPEAQTWVDGGRLAAEDLAKVGLKTRVSPVVRNIDLQRAGPKPGDFDITMSVFLDYQYAKTKSGTFWDSTSLQDAEVDALVEKIEQTVDPKARDKLSEDFQIMLARKYSNLMPLLSTNVHYGWYAYLKGFSPDFGRGTFLGWQDDRWLDKS